MDWLSRIFKKCDHEWRYAGSGLRQALISEWIFCCSKCPKKKWTVEGCFPDEESYNYYRAMMPGTFKEEWRFIVKDSFSGTTISKGG